MKEYKFVSREAGLSCSIIELKRAGVFEYYVLTEFSSDLYYSFGCEDRFSENALYRLFVRGYFDNIINDAKNDYFEFDKKLKDLLEIEI